MNMNLAHTSTQGRQRGVTLVELMISLVLGLVLTAGIIQVFVGNRTTYAFNDGLSRIQENARFSLDHIAYSVRMAGYSGCLSEVVVHNNLRAQLAFRDDIENGIQGYDANGTGTGDEFTAVSSDPAPSANEGNWTPSLPSQLAGLVIPGSDVLVVRGVAGSTRPLLTPFSSATELNTDESHDFMKGEILVVSDCQKASIFQLTDITGAGSAVKLVHDDEASFSPGNDSDIWDAEQEYGLGSEIARLNTYAFYVGRGEDGRPALFQLRLQRTSDTVSQFQPDELVSGIETMQVRYGLDADRNGAIETMVPADEVGDWSFVSSVEISLLARATEEYGAETDIASYRVGGTTRFVPAEDRRFRQVFSTTIGVRNRLP